MSERSSVSREILLKHIDDMLRLPEMPDPLEGLEDSSEYASVRKYIEVMRTGLSRLLAGDFSSPILERGHGAGQLKAWQAILMHFSWQIEQLAAGDFSQQIDFLGELSESFNAMVVAMGSSRRALHAKEQELTALSNSLHHEVELRTATIAYLNEKETRLKFMAYHDPLTEVYNRRSLFETATIMLSNAKLMDEYCTIAMFDIDHFKRFNDTYGHVEGDAALKHVSQIIMSQLRDRDIVGRYGGEEFVCCFAALNKEDSALLGERLRVRVADAPVVMESATACITISMGIVSVPPWAPGERNQEFLESIIRHADAAMYVAKNNGRNQIVVSDYPDFDVTAEL